VYEECGFVLLSDVQWIASPLLVSASAFHHLQLLPPLALLASAQAWVIAAAMTGGTIISRITNDWKFSNGILRDANAFVLETQ
jgi:hypothetical protein